MFGLEKNPPLTTLVGRQGTSVMSGDRKMEGGGAIGTVSKFLLLVHPQGNPGLYDVVFVSIEKQVCEAVPSSF